MATKFLTDIDLQGFIDLNENQLRNAVVHPLASAPSNPTIGQIYYDTGDEKVYVWTDTAANGGQEWISIGGVSASANDGTITLTAGTGLSGGQVFTTNQAADEEITFNIDYAGTDNIIDAATNLEGTAIATGDTIMYHDASDNNVKKGFVSDLPFNNYSHPNHSGDVTSSGDGSTTISNNAVTHAKYQQVAANTIIGNNTGTAGNVSALTKTNVLSLLNVEDGADVTDSINVKSALNATLSDLTIGASSDTITIPGDLVVTGTQTIANETISVIENNTIQFEGTVANDFETKLTAINPTADRTISLPNLSGNVALFSTAPTTTITATPTELNLLDGITTLSGSNTGDEPDASTTVKGIIEIATNLETTNGLDTARAVTSAGTKAAIDARTSAFNIGDGTNTSYTITHNFATRDVVIQLFDNSTYDTVYADVVRTTINTATITFASAPTTNDVRVLVHQIA